MPVTVKHKVLLCRNNKADKLFTPIATRDFDDANADEDFQALRLQMIVDATRSGAERPEFGVGVQTVVHPDGVNKDMPAVTTFEGFGPAGKIAADDGKKK